MPVKQLHLIVEEDGPALMMDEQHQQQQQNQQQLHLQQQQQEDHQQQNPKEEGSSSWYHMVDELMQEEGASSDGGDDESSFVCCPPAIWNYAPSPCMLPSSYLDVDGDVCNECAICTRPAHVRLTCTKELMCTVCVESKYVWAAHIVTCSIGSSCPMDFTVLEDFEDCPDFVIEYEADDEDEQLSKAPWGHVPAPWRIRGPGGFVEQFPLADMWGGWQLRINVYMCFMLNDLVPNLEGARPLKHPMGMSSCACCMLHAQTMAWWQHHSIASSVGI